MHDNSDIPLPKKSGTIPPPRTVQPTPGGPFALAYPRTFAPGEIDEDAVRVLRRLHQRGHTAYLVGGGVRDLLLGNRPKDFDIATSARPHEVRHIFRNCRIIGRRFRLAHIVFHGGKIIETATFRRDPGQEEWDGAQDTGATTDSVEIALEDGEPTIAFAPQVPREKSRDQDLLIRDDNTFGEPHEDAVRRDFTVNGLFYDIESEEVLDYVGGMPDLHRRVLRTIGVPEVRFREDPVRMMRAVKFAARLDLGLSVEVADAILLLRNELTKSAKARVLEEIFRLMRGGAARRSIFLLWELGLLAVVLPELSAWLDDDARHGQSLFHRLYCLDQIVENEGVPSDAILLAALLFDTILEATAESEDPAREYEDFMLEITQNLSLPRRLKDRVRAIIGTERRIAKGRAGKLVGRDFYPDAYLFHRLLRMAAGQEPAPDAAPEPAPRDNGDAALSPGATEVDGEPRRRRRRRRRFA